jgi:hypothetical protein
MLSAAHILAMDTKNLLDVCDSIRARHPDIIYQITEPKNSPALELPQFHQSPQKKPIQQQDLPEDFYENVVKAEKQPEVTEQIYCNQNLPHTDIGIYDNSSIIQEQQLRIVEEPIMSPSASNGVEAK